MRIQPISVNTNTRNHYSKSSQTNFTGLKGFLKGTAVGAGATAAGVTLIAGAAALPLFLGYIVLNGAISGTAGHFIENQNK